MASLSTDPRKSFPLRLRSKILFILIKIERSFELYSEAISTQKGHSESFFVDPRGMNGSQANCAA